MALSIMKKVKPAAAQVSGASTPPAPAQEVQAPWEGEAQLPKQTPPVKQVATPSVDTKVSSGTGLSFLKKGAAAQADMAKEEHRAEMAAKNNIYRYFVKTGGSGACTFLDGDLLDGVLDIHYFHEHNINMNGKWGNFFICTQDSEPCPICEGSNFPSYVGAMTVIDHSSYVSKKDNKTYKDQVRLFVAKRDTIKQLQIAAVKRGGLAGCRFDVARVGDKSPAVGSMFDFTTKYTPAQLATMYAEKAKPIDYVTYLGGLYMPASELRKMGFGTGVPPVGSESIQGATNYDDAL